MAATATAKPRRSRASAKDAGTRFERSVADFLKIRLDDDRIDGEPRPGRRTAATSAASARPSGVVSSSSARTPPGSTCRGGCVRPRLSAETTTPWPGSSCTKARHDDPGGAVRDHEPRDARGPPPGGCAHEPLLRRRVRAASPRRLPSVRGWTLADVLVTDPPYGTQFSAANSKGGYGRRQNAGIGPRASPSRTTRRPKRATRFSPCGRPPRARLRIPPPSRPAGALGRSNRLGQATPGMNGGPWRYTHESIYARGFVRNGNGNFSVLTAFPADQALHIHAKPVALMESLLECAPPGVIADPFAGSGSTS